MFTYYILLQYTIYNLIYYTSNRLYIIIDNIEEYS